MATHGDAEDLPRDVAFHNADGFELRMTFCDTTRDVRLCPFVGSEAADRDDMQSLFAARSPPRLRR